MWNLTGILPRHLPRVQIGTTDVDRGGRWAVRLRDHVARQEGRGLSVYVSEKSDPPPWPVGRKNAAEIDVAAAFAYRFHVDSNFSGTHTHTHTHVHLRMKVGHRLNFRNNISRIQFDGLTLSLMGSRETLSLCWIIHPIWGYVPTECTWTGISFHPCRSTDSTILPIQEGFVLHVYNETDRQTDDPLEQNIS